MSDAVVALVLGSLFWLLGGVWLVAALFSGWTLFVPFALAFIAFGVGYCVLGALWLLMRANSGPGSARLPAR